MWCPNETKNARNRLHKRKRREKNERSEEERANASSEMNCVCKFISHHSFSQSVVGQHSCRVDVFGQHSIPFNSFSLNIKDSPPPSPSSLKRQFVIHLSHLSRHSHHDGCVHGFCPLSCMWCVISFCCMGYTLVTVERSGRHCSEPKNLFARLGWTFSLFEYCLEHDAMVI